MAINVKFVGSFRSYAGKNSLAFRTKDSISLRVLVKKLAEKSPKLKSVLINPESGDPKTNMLVLVNGREISVLKGFETTVNDGDELVFVPVVHGG